MQVQDFFADYMDAFNTRDVQRMVDRFSVPAIIIEEQQRWVLAEKGDIQRHVQRRVDEYLQKDINSVKLELMQVIKLSEKFVFCNLAWQFFDQDDTLSLICPVSYTLQMSGQDVRHIVSVVKDKDKQVGAQ